MRDFDDAVQDLKDSHLSMRDKFRQMEEKMLLRGGEGEVDDQQELERREIEGWFPRDKVFGRLDGNTLLNEKRRDNDYVFDVYGDMFKEGKKLSPRGKKPLPWTERKRIERQNAENENALKKLSLKTMPAGGGGEGGAPGSHSSRAGGSRKSLMFAGGPPQVLNIPGAGGGGSEAAPQKTKKMSMKLGAKMLSAGGGLRKASLSPASGGSSGASASEGPGTKEWEFKNMCLHHGCYISRLWFPRPLVPVFVRTVLVSVRTMSYEVDHPPAPMFG